VLIITTVVVCYRNSVNNDFQIHRPIGTTELRLKLK